jgi:hypothetical protein
VDLDDVHSGNDVSSTHAGTFRPSNRLPASTCANRTAGHADGFAQLGAYGLIPTSGDEVRCVLERTSRTTPDQEAEELRSRLGGFGVRGGIGADNLVGQRAHARRRATSSPLTNRGAAKVSDRTTTSILIYGEAGLFLGFVL